MTATMTTPLLSEEYADAIREGRTEDAGRLSPYMACLLPLLTTLGWRDAKRDVLEALPHYAAHLDLTDLRNVLVNLGYDSRPLPVKLQSLERRLLPGVFVGNDGRVLMLAELDGDTYRYFDGSANARGEGPLRGSGTLYALTDRAGERDVRELSDTPWFTDLLTRFSKLLKHLLLMTFVLNIVAVCVPLFVMFVYDRIIAAKALDSLIYVVAGITFALLIELAVRLVRSTTLGTIAGRIDYLVGTASFRQILLLPPIMTDRSSVTAQLSKLRQFDAVRDFFAGQSAAILIEAPFVFLFLLVIGILGGWLAIVPCLTAFAYVAFGAFWMPRMRRHLRVASAARTEREQILMETFSGLRELKALGAEHIWLERFSESTTDAVIANRDAAIDQAVLTSLTNTLMLLSATVILGFGTLQVMDGAMSVGALIAVMALSWRVQTPVQGIFLACFRFESIANGIRDLNQLFAIPIELSGRKASLMAREYKGQITFDRVSFRYGQKLDPALIGVSFSVPPRGFLAVVGSNGSGKSTLLKLVNGLYPIQSGQVFIDGVDSRQFNASDLRRIVAYVPQNPSLFRGSIAQNLRLKDPMATDDDLRLACFKTGILRMVEALPDGFDSMVGDENTLRLPGGLIRGICIARAFVRRSPVLLLDEPAAGLDNDNDEALMLQLRALRGHTTVVMVSHRPSHIRLADRVLVIDRGIAKRICQPDEYLAAVSKQ